MIDPATGWFESQQYDDKQSITVANIVEQEWFSRYPWPRQITFHQRRVTFAYQNMPTLGGILLFHHS
jgi:hypothetical protein